ncbi:MAG: response regulator transcription factor [Pseudomonadota bacterium]
MSLDTNMGQRRKALIVEDERITARDLAEIVEDLGYEVVGPVANADDAIWLMKLHDPDLVLTDILIEGLNDGITFSRMVREEFDAAIVFISSHADPQTINRASAVKPNGYIVKPFSVEGVAAAVATAMANFVKEHADVDLQLLDENRSLGLSQQEMSLIDDHLDKHYDEDVTIEALAQLVGLKPATFSRHFRTCKGMSPYQYVVEYRIHEAKRLLRHTDMTLAEISLSVGYSSQAHFTTAFGKICGVTPGRYRRL